VMSSSRTTSRESRSGRLALKMREGGRRNGWRVR
jgi:hypothetical protein